MYKLMKCPHCQKETNVDTRQMPQSDGQTIVINTKCDECGHWFFIEIKATVTYTFEHTEVF